MPLRRLELYNFKSYKDTQVIDLGDAPFMCIIGPNGAGKSNLMDAISFVLGVKSAQLRSTQLKDLVYRGRKALQTDEDESMAETQGSVLEDEDRTAFVMAVYEDEEGKEWKFKRSISTQGNSTYYINNRESTWKAYNAQLERFNILVKAKNFLVFQGDVEGVASQDSKQLAALIDRISGSADLAAAYNAAQDDQARAAELHKSNYNKTRGIIAEVKQFKEQRDEMKQWQRMVDQKVGDDEEAIANLQDDLVHRHMLWRLYHLTDEINESTRKVEEASGQLSELKEALVSNDKEVRSTKKDQAQAQLQVKKRQGAVQKAEKAFDEKKPEIVALEAQIAHAEKKAKNAATLVERVRKDEERQAESYKTLEQGAEAIKQRMDEAIEKQRQSSVAAGRALSGQDLEDYRKLRAEANATVVTDRQKLEGMKREQKTQRDALTSVEDKLALAQTRQTKLAKEIDSLEKREEELSTSLSTSSEERERLKAQLDQAQAERERTNIKETELNEKLQDVFGKLLSAGADKRESEREDRFKQNLAQLRRIFPGVHGRVLDLCQPTAHKYDTAVATVLGRNAESIVVEHEKVAIDCIEYMRNQRAGQATFIPLDTIQVKPTQEKYRAFAKGARLAIDCIKYDPAVARAMLHACGSSLICDTMDVARHVCYEKNQEVKAVTLEGTVIHKSGLITGGTGSSTGRRFNDADVQSLQRAKETYMQQLQELSQSRSKNDDDRAVLDALSRLGAESSLAKDDLSALQLRLNGLKQELKQVESEITKLNPQIATKSQSLQALDAELATLAERINEADDRVFEAFCARINVANIREYEDVQLKLAKQESAAVEKYAVDHGRVTHQREFERSQLNSTRERLASLESTVEKSRSSIESLQESKTVVEAELEDLQKSIDKQKEKLAAATEAYDAATESVDSARSAARQTQKRLDSLMKEIAGWNTEIEKSSSDRHAIYRRCRLEEIDLPIVSGRLDRVPIEETADDAMDVDRETQDLVVTNDYGIEPDFSLLEDEDKTNRGEEYGRDYEQKINRLKVDLESLAPNLKAADRLKEVQEGLNDAEREADEAKRDSTLARSQFLELKKKRAYSHMSGCIDKIYKDLTKSTTFPTGGVGFLSLEDAEEPYLSGVKYNVMPPGKRFVEMEQLSGGEKTMAALALLFAIHRWVLRSVFVADISFHPAPFFVLDEVDAALDPTNVAKLARYVRDQAEKQVQFLIISLKATLYEHADGLVGVYREQEDNTSKTLTLDLRKYVE